MLHCEFSATVIVPVHPIVCAHAAWPAPHLPPFLCTHFNTKSLSAEHAHVVTIWCRDEAGRAVAACCTEQYPVLLFPTRYCNEHLLCPPHVFWTGWGPWERCTAQCGGGIQARRRTCENGPDCVGCNVVSGVLLVPSPQPAARTAELAQLGVFIPRCPAHTRCTANTRCPANTKCSAHTRSSTHTRRSANTRCSKNT